MGTKRKLDEDEVPTPVKEPASPTPASPPEATSFASFGLDPRLLQAITQEDFATPTRVQAKAIPHILEGKDLLGTSILPDERLGADFRSSSNDRFWQDGHLPHPHPRSHSAAKQCM